jgi:hypothetical protein
LTLVCSDRHVRMEGYPIEQGAEIEISLLPPGIRGCATRSNQASPAPCSSRSNPKAAIASRLSIEAMLQADLDSAASSATGPAGYTGTYVLRLMPCP